MSSIPIQILTYKDRQLTDALLLEDLAPSALAEVEKEWGPLRRGGVPRAMSLAPARKSQARSGPLPFWI